MGMWGLGISSCDEYSEIYEEFFEKYDEGVEVDVIISHFINEANEVNLRWVEYNTYYALGKALWKCGIENKFILNKIKEIIDNDYDSLELLELGLHQSDCNKRREKLNEFYKSLLNENPKPRKRKPKKEIRKLEIGTVVQYKCNSKFRYAIILDIYDYSCAQDVGTYLVGLFSIDSEIQLTLQEVIKNNFWSITAIDITEFIPKNRYKEHGLIKVDSNIHKVFMNDRTLFLYPGKVTYLPNSISWSCEYGAFSKDIMYNEIKDFNVTYKL